MTPLFFNEIKQENRFFLKHINEYKILIFFCVFSFLFSLLLISVYDYPVSGDGVTYFDYGVNLYKGHGYSYAKSPPYFPSNLREPIYPIFIAIIFKIFGISKVAVQISQSILNIFIIIIGYNIAELVFVNKKRSIIAAALIAISPTISGYPALIANETLTLFFLLLATFFFLLTIKEENLKGVGYAGITGLFAGCLSLVKMIYVFLPILICFAVFIFSKKTPHKYYKILLIVMAFVSTMLPWFAFNNRVYNNPFFLTNRGGFTTGIKAGRIDWTLKEIFVFSSIYPISESMTKKYFPDEYNRVAYIDGSSFKEVFDKFKSFIDQGDSEMTADNKLRAESLYKIKQNIPKYIIQSISDFHFMLYFEGLPLSQFTDFFKKKIVASIINFIFKIVSLMAVFFAFKGIFIIFAEKENLPSKIVFLIPVVYTFFMYSAIIAIPRHTFPIIPFIYTLTAVKVADIFERRLV